MTARSNRIIVFAVTCGLLCVLAAVEWNRKPQFGDSLNDDDEVNLLQERVLKRHLSKKPADKMPAAEPETRTPSVCDDVTVNVGQLDLDTFEDLCDEQQPRREALAVEIEPLVDSIEGGRGVYATEETYARNLRHALDLLIVLMLLDRCRCWCSGADKVKTCDEGPSVGNPDAFVQLMRVAAAGDEVGAREMLRKGASVVDKDFWGCTLLHAAAKGGCTQLLAELVDLGAQVDATDSWDETPLHIASRAGHVDTCVALISWGADLDALNAQSFTPLVVAASAEHNAVTFMLMQKGAGVGELTEQDLPLLLQELLSDGKERVLEEVENEFKAEADENGRQWPTDEDWEEHMQESIDNDVGA